MATKKTTVPKTEEPITEEEVKEAEPEKSREELAEEVEKLKAQLSAQRGGGQQSDYDRVKQACEESAEAGTDPWTVEIEVLVPHREKTEDPWYWINVNGMSAQIPANDRYQKMKLPFANILMDTLRAERHSLDFQESLEVYDPVVNPHR